MHNIAYIELEEAILKLFKPQRNSNMSINRIILQTKTTELAKKWLSDTVLCGFIDLITGILSGICEDWLKTAWPKIRE